MRDRRLIPSDGASRQTPLPEPERSRFTRGDYEIDLFRWAGPAPPAPRLLLVHGIGMGHAVYDRFVAAARPHARIVCVDLPGFGDAPEPKSALPIAQTADLLAEALTDADLSPVVAIGHSMGAQVVAELAARHPALVERVVLIAPTVNRHERTLARQALRMVQDLSRNTPAVMLRGALAYARTGPRWFRKKLGPVLEHRIEETLPRVTQTTLVLRGEEDAVSPHGWATEVVDLLPRGDLQELPDRGHEALISSGEPAAETVLNWLRAGK